MVFLHSCLLHHTVSFPNAAFVGVSSSYFAISLEGEVSLASVLSPQSTYSFTVDVIFTGTAVNGGTVSGRATTQVHVNVTGQYRWAWELLCGSLEQMYPPSPTCLPFSSISPSFPPSGCRQEEGGGHVWPVMHPCGIAYVNCSDFDRAFDKYGIITRQCTREGGHD